MSSLGNTAAIAILVVALGTLITVLGGCLGLAIAHLRRSKLRWGRGFRIAVGAGGAVLAGVALLVPAIGSWIAYLAIRSSVAEVITQAVPEERAALLAGAIERAIGGALAAGMGEIALIVPCAVIAALALTVPFYLREK